MPAAYVLLKCVGKAVVKNVANLFSFGVGGSILVDAWDYWQAATCEEERRGKWKPSRPFRRPNSARKWPASSAKRRPGCPRNSRRGSPPTSARCRRRFVAPCAAQRPERHDHRGRDRLPQARRPGRRCCRPACRASRRATGRCPASIGNWWSCSASAASARSGRRATRTSTAWPPVALKFCLDPAAKERLLKHEAKIINQVMQQGKHEGIVPLLHTYLSADPPCLEYEYVEGGDLAGLIQGRQRRPAPPPGRPRRPTRWRRSSASPTA